MDTKKLIQRVERMEALAYTLLEEATSIKRELAGVSTPAAQKGRYSASSARVLANRNKTILKNMNKKK